MSIFLSIRLYRLRLREAMATWDELWLDNTSLERW